MLVSRLVSRLSVRKPAATPSPAIANQVTATKTLEGWGAGKETAGIVEVEPAADDVALPHRGQGQDAEEPEEQLNQQRHVTEELDVGGGQLGKQPVAGKPGDADDDAQQGSQDDAQDGYQGGIGGGDHQGVEKGVRGVVGEEADADGGLVFPVEEGEAVGNIPFLDGGADVGEEPGHQGNDDDGGYYLGGPLDDSGVPPDRYSLVG